MIKNIYVFYGGKSVEHEVSLMSAKNVINSLNKKYDIYPVFIDKEGRFLSLEKVSSVEDIKDLVAMSDKKPLDTIVDFLKSLKDDSIMFSLVHGSMGEDGTLQGFFDSLNLPYVGSSLKASAITFDKITTNEVLTSMGFEKAKFLAVLKSNIEEDIDLEIKKIEEEINYPLFVKPSNAGSSVGANKAGNRDELKNSLLEAKKYDDKILVEEFIDGRELEVSVMGLDDPIAAYPGEHIVSDHVFFDYNSKYFDQTTIINPRADLDEKTEDEIRKTAVKCFKALGLTAYSRVDIFLEKTGRILINEVNTIPGMTPTSLFPKSWEKIGNIPLTEILDKLIDYSLIAFEEKSKIQRSL